MRSVFITLEGGEGSGKTTQAALLKEAFARAGLTAVFTREPGGGKSGDAIRSLLLEGAGDKWHPTTELLLFQAARVEHVERMIRPALLRGEHVVCDRFLHSSLVYQGHARGLGQGYIQALHNLTLGQFLPDITLYIDIEPSLGLERANRRRGVETRFEGLAIDFHESVRSGFLALAKAEPQRMMVIDGSLAIEAVHEHVKDTLRNMIGIDL